MPIVEEIVDFENWMVDEQNPTGIVIDLDSDLLTQHPEV